MREVDKKLNGCEDIDLERLKKFIEISEEMWWLWERKHTFGIPRGKREFEREFLNLLKRIGKDYGLTSSEDDDGAFVYGFEIRYDCYFKIFLYEKEIFLMWSIFGKSFLWEFPNFLFKSTIKKADKLWRKYNYWDRYFKEVKKGEK
jgi:hypothetical protein